MTDTASPEINVEDLMRRIRVEVARRRMHVALSQSARATVAPSAEEVTVTLPAYIRVPVSLPRAREGDGCVAEKSEYALAEFLAYHDEDFVRSAYRGILRREPDPEGFAHYLDLLRSGRLSKAEIIGQMHFSPEGKSHAVPVRGLLLPFALHSAYRLPVLGYGLALANFIVRLPSVVRNWKRFEAYMLRERREQGLHVNVLASQVEGIINQLQQKGAERDAQLVQLMADLTSSRPAAVEINARLDDLAQHKADAADLATTATVLGEALAQKAGTAQVEALAAQSAESILGLTHALEAKADAGELAAAATLFGEKIVGVTQALETKADIGGVAHLSGQLVDLEQRKADAGELAATTTLLGEKIAGLTQALETKADAGEVAAAADLFGTKIVGLTQALETKADHERVAHLTSQLVDLEQRKADAVEVAAAANLFGAKIVGLTQALETKADHERVAHLSSQLVDLEQRKADAGELAATATRFGEDLAQKADAATIKRETQEIQRQILDQKRNVLDQQRRLARLLEDARKRLPEPISTGQLETMVAEEDRLLDAFYVSFEDRFRGTREDIKERVAIYLPIVREAGAGTKNAPILDIGCGRGEWLQLLQENDLVARGADINRVMVSQCKELGLEVAEADGIEYLRSLKANSLGAVTGIHIIEHIPFRRVISLFDEALRVLKPGGVAIFETPNPENLIVGACSFYYDPTHLNPLPPEPMRFVMEARGFGGVEILRLHPQPESAMLREGTEQLQQIVNNLMFSAQDYALVARKN